MREILFRGKDVSFGDWIEGDLIRNDSSCYPAVFIGCIEASRNRYDELSVDGHYLPQVDPETVGQYTGLNDKNGKRIFEGDILSFPDTGEDGYEYKEGYDFTNVAAVCWNNGRWELESYGNHYSGVMDDMELSCHYDFISIFRIGEVIGNIHDNPELLEVEG